MAIETEGQDIHTLTFLRLQESQALRKRFALWVSGVAVAGLGRGAAGWGFAVWGHSLVFAATGGRPRGYARPTAEEELKANDSLKALCPTPKHNAYTRAQARVG